MCSSKEIHRKLQNVNYISITNIYNGIVFMIRLSPCVIYAELHNRIRFHSALRNRDFEHPVITEMSMALEARFTLSAFNNAVLTKFIKITPFEIIVCKEIACMVFQIVFCLF